MNRVQDKVALITGGASGLGLASGKLLLEEGARVIFTDKDSKSLNQIPEFIDAKYKDGAFVVRRGGVSTSKLTGYDVLFIPFIDGKPTGIIETFLSGFIASKDRGEIFGRPVGIAETNNGEIIITDDVGGRLLMISSIEKE